MALLTSFGCRFQVYSCFGAPVTTPNCAVRYTSTSLQQGDNFNYKGSAKKKKKKVFQLLLSCSLKLNRDLCQLFLHKPERLNLNCQHASDEMLGGSSSSIQTFSPCTHLSDVRSWQEGALCDHFSNFPLHAKS